MKARILLALTLLVATIISISVISCSNPVIKGITTEKAFDLIQENKSNHDFVIIDVRTPEEFADGHLENALNINFNSGTFSDDINKLDKDKTYLVYCRTGNRSAQAAAVMADLGFREIYDMGGIIDWTVKGFPVVK
ncbi:rhodanese-like domain-containing protein [Chloroflexota bacterium]